MILDTAYLGDLVGGDRDAIALSRRLDASDEPMRLPTAVVWELFYGLGRVDDSEHATELRRKYAALIESTIPAELDDSVARRAGTLRGTHSTSDRHSDLDGADSIVAAHGLVLGEPVVSSDGDFRAVEGLEVLAY